jgi:hypothetical protein
MKFRITSCTYLLKNEVSQNLLDKLKKEFAFKENRSGVFFGEIEFEDLETLKKISTLFDVSIKTDEEKSRLIILD